jgi:hypothetical protein
MPGSNMTELMAQFVKIQTEIAAAKTLLEDLEGSTVIVTVEIDPRRCPPIDPGSPPTLCDGCELTDRAEESVTVQDLKDCLVKMKIHTGNIIWVLNEADSDLTLPSV